MANTVWLQETKQEKINMSLVVKLWGGNSMNWLHLSSLGSSGGLMCLWDKEAIKLEEQRLGDISTTLWCKFMEEDIVWRITNVYGPMERPRKEAFWKVLGDIRGNLTLPWCIGGYFNDIRFVWERKGEFLVDRFM